jgi:MOSC domain-containing protein YiiM
LTRENQYHIKRSEVDMLNVSHLSLLELEAGLEHIKQAPKDAGDVKLIVRRPAVDERESIQTAELNSKVGVVGDTWLTRGSKHMPDGSANPDAQVTLMNARAAALLAQSEERWSLAGDQFYVDMDISEANLPPGTRLRLGTAVIEISAQPHTGCAKFSQRFGVDAHKFVNSAQGKPLRLRGVNARVVEAGTVHVGDAVRKI